MRVFHFLWRWFKNLDLARQIILMFLFGIALYLFYGMSIMPLRLKYENAKQDCGKFVSYEYVHHHPARGGTPWMDTWIIIDSWGKKYKFLYIPRFHKHISFVETDLKERQKVCFEYLNQWIPVHGKIILKSIELRGDE